MATTQEPKIGRFIDPLTDWGFRHLFGQEPNKEILIVFSTTFSKGEKHIVDLEYAPNEHDGDDEEHKRVVFDLHCRGDNGSISSLRCSVRGRITSRTGRCITPPGLSSGS